jgi:hypothetical protein
MKQITRILGYLAIFIVATTCVAQKKQSARELRARSVRQERLERIGVSRDVAKWFARMGYSDKTLQELKNGGVDVLSSIGDFYGKDERTKTVLSDCIVIGTVSKLEYDSLRSARYHTLVHLTVEKYLRNDHNLKKKELLILVESGPIAGGEVEWNSNDVQFSVNERVLLFYDVGSKRVVGLPGGKYLIENENATCRGQSLPLKEVLDNIRATMAILQRTQYKDLD